MLRTSILCSTVAFLVLFGFVASACAVTYEMHVLGSGYALDINSSGTIVGYYKSGGIVLPCTWTLSGVRTDLPQPTGLTGFQARAINDAGVIAGSQSENIVRWNTDGSIDTKSIASGLIGAIDSSGNAYGGAKEYSGGVQSYALKWTTSGDVISIDASHARIVAVNASGTVVGLWGTTEQVWHAALWTGPGNRTEIPDLPGMTFASARGINDAGVVVGYSATSGETTRPFRWSSSLGITDLGVLTGCLYGEAMDIDGNGLIVGRSYNPTSPSPYTTGNATLWTPTGSIIDLGRPSGSMWSTAVAINSSGQIVGYTDDGRALLWTAVPEPSVLLALLFGVGGLAFRRRPRYAGTETGRYV